MTCKRTSHKKLHKVKSSILPRPCSVCGSLFTPRKSQLKLGMGRYCSLSCLGISRRGNSCGRENGKNKLRIIVCQELWIIVCQECGVEFTGRTAKLCRHCIASKAGKISRIKHPLIAEKSPRWKGGISKDIRAWRKEWRIKNRRKNAEKYKTRDITSYAITKGELIRDNCEDCGSSIDVQAHHSDYSKPLNVTWLCRTCHNKRHGKLKDGVQRRAYLARKAKQNVGTFS